MVAPSGVGGGGGGSGTLNPLAASDKALIQRQHEVIKMQDEVLLDIEKGVDRLHGQVAPPSPYTYSPLNTHSILLSSFPPYTLGSRNQIRNYHAK
ncbi:hypothetical protein EON63_15210 [archaeon]|nr:MAG: hypothetical protein EON63_15210 [archaeon]